MPTTARATVKQMVRQEAAEALRDKQIEDLDWFVTMAASPSSQARLRTYIDSLGKGSKKSEDK